MVNKFYFIRINLLFKTLLLVIGLALIFFVFDIRGLIYNKNTLIDQPTYSDISSPDTSFNDSFISTSYDNLNILVIADSHLSTTPFFYIKKLVSEFNISLVVHLGDHTDYGSDEELKKAKSLLDSLEIRYVALPGDRDLGASNGTENFYKYFPKIDSFSIKNLNLLFVNNSANFTPLSKIYLDYVLENISKSHIIFFSQPILVDKGNILENKYMGSLNAFNLTKTEEIENQKNYLSQRNKILNKIRATGNKLVVSGDHHRSAQFTDPNEPSIKYLINGAVAEYISSNGIKMKQKIFQSQRVSVISVDKNLDYKIKEILIPEE